MAHKKFGTLNYEKLKENYTNSNNRVILLDINGTLIDNNKNSIVCIMSYL